MAEDTMVQPRLAPPPEGRVTRTSLQVPLIAWLTFREARRRRLFWIGAALAVAFLAIFGIGFHAIYQEATRNMGRDSVVTRQGISAVTMAGLYAVNFLVVMVSVLISVDTISGEIASHSIQSIVTKPIRRWEIVIGKFLGLSAMVAATLFVLGGGVLVISYAVSGVLPTNLPQSLLLMLLEGLILVSVTLLGGTLFSTLANGVLAFMLFGLAFLGGWTEQIGAILHIEAAINVGIVSSLLMPTEALWRRAAYLMQPPGLATFLSSPFVSASLPSPAMVVYAILYGVAALGAAVRIFERRDL